MSKCKYYLEKEVVSYDGGITWNETGVTRKGNLYEESSEDCTDPSVQYRWINMDVTTDYICDGTNKYYKQKKQVSFDGIIWQDVTPAEYQRGSIYEVNSPDCQPKLQATYSNGQTYYLTCDGNTTLTTGDTRPTGYERSAMTSAVIGDCVTNIGNAAFQYCRGLTSIDIPNSVTSIGEGAFYDCTSLTSINIPSGVTSIGEHTFGNCYSLTSIVIPSGVTTIGIYAFDNCYSLTSIVIPSGVTSIGNYAFASCSGLTSCTIGSGVTSIGTRAFSYCTSLTSIDIPSGVTSIGNRAFRGCGSLTSVTIGSGVTSIGREAFEGCTSLTGVTVNAVNPPTLGEYTFDNTNNCPIYVQASSVEAYKSTSGWSSYASRIQAIP